VGSVGPSEFEFLRELVRRDSSIVIAPEDAYLAESRLARLTQSEGFASVQHLLQTLRRVGPLDLRRKVLDAMTNNETWFFRDASAFAGLRKFVLPELVEKRRREKRLTIWSAACSTGQEPYSVAMLVRQYFREIADWDIQILGTDICNTALEKAKAGIYSQLEVNRGLPAQMLVSMFERKELNWKLRDEIRRMVTFRLINLAALWSGFAQADIVLLRNVLIYFDEHTKRTILRRIRNYLRPDGYLLLGCAETVLGLAEAEFERVEIDKTSWYRRRA